MNKDNLITIGFLIFLIIFTGADIFHDINEGIEFSHLLHEALILAFSSLIIIFKLYKSLQSNRTILTLTNQANQATLEAHHFKNEIQKYKNGLVEAIGQQFKIWGLTDSEADVALLLIKGLSMKEIATTRGTSEATVRQQSSSIYQKSNLDNRNQLTSYFLEDLF
ncbi:hypothetical protein BIY24_03845 [Halobacteriovorax marinus]|uniref:helix-turn-helix transcriptional regulator n=1 Tax=Halobacteriovorax marinus TaxID=97084 RepID=UPI000BC3441E|nr:LuxR C-terminal-related transcriptional regulator [Halobacteriovorax marinus]ATH07099.1 hypothetical protein BIY24_03845 [Halobacteriovorax marinus]